MAASLFEKYGGFGTVSKIVMAFYDRVLDSDEIGEYFEDVEMARLIDHQTKFVATIMGGPASYTDENLRQVHAHLGINRADFQEMVRLFRMTIEEFGMEPGDVSKVVSEITSREPYIVTGQ